MSTSPLSPGSSPRYQGQNRVDRVRQVCQVSQVTLDSTNPFDLPTCTDLHRPDRPARPGLHEQRRDRRLLV